MKACVVDDDPSSRQLLSEFLEDQGLEVVTFDHPDKTSVKKKSDLAGELSETTTKFLIMDVRFGRDAEGLTKGLKAVEALAKEKKLTSNCSVLFVSQFGREAINFHSLEETLEKNGITFYWFDKPVKNVELGEIIRKYL